MGRGSAKVMVPSGRVKCSSSTAVYGAEAGDEGRRGVEREGREGGEEGERRGESEEGRGKGGDTRGGQLRTVNCGWECTPTHPHASYLARLSI